MQSKSTVGELLPDLITTFLPHEYQLAAIDGNQPSSVTLVQGLSEWYYLIFAVVLVSTSLSISTAYIVSTSLSISTAYIVLVSTSLSISTTYIVLVSTSLSISTAYIVLVSTSLSISTAYIVLVSTSPSISTAYIVSTSLSISTAYIVLVSTSPSISTAYIVLVSTSLSISTTYIVLVSTSPSISTAYIVLVSTSLSISTAYIVLVSTSLSISTAYIVLVSTSLSISTAYIVLSLLLSVYLQHILSLSLLLSVYLQHILSCLYFSQYIYSIYCPVSTSLSISTAYIVLVSTSLSISTAYIVLVSTSLSISTAYIVLVSTSLSISTAYIVLSLLLPVYLQHILSLSLLLSVYLQHILSCLSSLSISTAYIVLSLFSQYIYSIYCPVSTSPSISTAYIVLSLFSQYIYSIYCPVSTSLSISTAYIVLSLFSQYIYSIYCPVSLLSVYLQHILSLSLLLSVYLQHILSCLSSLSISTAYIVLSLFSQYIYSIYCPVSLLSVYLQHILSLSLFSQYIYSIYCPVSTSLSISTAYIVLISTSLSISTAYIVVAAKSKIIIFPPLTFQSVERELDLTEKPLEIVLDCSSRGISSPRFIFKSSLATTGVPLTPHRIKRFMSCEGVEEGFAECSVDCDHNLYNPEHYTSMTSLSSNLSIASNKSKKSKSTSSLVTKTSKKKKLAAQQQVLSNQNSSSHNSISSSHSRLHAAIQQDAPSPASTLKKNRHKAAAVSSFFSRSLRGQKKRNVRSLADSFPNSFDQDSSNNREEETEEDEDNDDEGIHFSVNTLVSHHVTLERKFSLSTVMHIYYTEGKQAQVYKSVLVSEKATTRELIAQALERYNMRMKDPSDFTLFDVIGKWQEVTTASALESQLQYQGNWNRGGGIDANSTLSNLSLLNTSPSSPNHMAVEEFVVCYCRELAPSESPYKMQYYLTAQEGFTRRFELQSKVSGERGICHAPYHKENSHSMDTVEWPDEDTPTPHDGNNIKEDMADTEIFEDALHRKRARRNRILHPSVDITNPDNSITILDSPGEELNLVGERSEGREEVGGMTLDNKMNVLRGSHRLQADDHDDLDIPISTNTSFAPNITTLGCSSPDSGVEFQKRTTQSNSNKSSVSSEQSELGNMAITSTESHIASTLCPGNLKSAFLLSLHLCNPHEEPLIYRLNDDSTEIVINSEPSASLSSASSKNRIFLISSKIGSEGLLCSICRSPPSMEPGSIHSHTHNKNIHTNSSYTSCTYNLIRGQSKLSLLHDGEEVTGSATLRHGNLLTIGDSYLFMFQDYSAIENGKNYCWRPKICSSVVEEMEDQRKSSSSRETITEMDSKSRTEGNTTGFKDHSLSSQRSDALEKDGTSPIAVEILTVDNRVNCNRLACLQELQEPTSSYSSHVEPLMLAKSPSSVATTVNVTQVPTSSSTPRVGFELEPVFPTTAGKETSSVYSTCMSHKTRAEKLKKNYHLALGKTHSLPLPTDRKLVFSFKTTEEDKLLSHIIMEDRKGDESTSVSHSPCKLAPAYILAMCTEYSIMSSGPEAVRRFVQKTIDRIQDVVWVSLHINFLYIFFISALPSPHFLSQHLSLDVCNETSIYGTEFISPQLIA